MMIREGSRSNDFIICFKSLYKYDMSILHDIVEAERVVIVDIGELAELFEDVLNARLEDNGRHFFFRDKFDDKRCEVFYGIYFYHEIIKFVYDEKNDIFEIFGKTPAFPVEDIQGETLIFKSRLKYVNYNKLIDVLENIASNIVASVNRIKEIKEKLSLLPQYSLKSSTLYSFRLTHDNGTAVSIDLHPDTSKLNVPLVKFFISLLRNRGEVATIGYVDDYEQLLKVINSVVNNSSQENITEGRQIANTFDILNFTDKELESQNKIIKKAYFDMFIDLEKLYDYLKKYIDHEFAALMISEKIHIYKEYDNFTEDAIYIKFVPPGQIHSWFIIGIKQPEYKPHMLPVFEYSFMRPNYSNSYGELKYKEEFLQPFLKYVKDEYVLYYKEIQAS